MRLTLSLPWLEIRYSWPMSRRPVGTRRQPLSQESEAEILSVCGTGWGDLDLYGAAGTKTRPARAGVGDGGLSPPVCVEMAGGMQSPPGHGRRHRFLPCLCSS